MNGAMRNGHDGGGHVTGDTLRRLIDEGDASARPGTGTRGRPTDATLRDLAAALNIAASAPSSPAHEQAAHEAAALAAFRDAHAVPAAAGRLRRSTLRDRLHRARSAVLAGVAVAVLGGGVGVAAAGGGIPFVGGDEADRSAHPSASGAEATGPPAPAASATAPTGPAVPAAPAASSRGAGTGTGRPTPAPGAPGDADDPDAGPNAGPDGAGEMSDRALRSLCTARARNPHLAPRALVTAAGGRDRIGAYCATLLSTPPADHPPPGGSPTGKPDDAPTHPTPQNPDDGKSGSRP